MIHVTPRPAAPRSTRVRLAELSVGALVSVTERDRAHCQLRLQPAEFGSHPFPDYQTPTLTFGGRGRFVDSFQSLAGEPLEEFDRDP